VEAAADGDYVMIEPGKYEESVFVEKRIHLRGNTEYPRDEIELSSSLNVLRFETDSASVSHLRVRQTGGRFNGVLIRRGEVVLTDIDIQSAGMGAIACCSEGSFLQLSYSYVHECAGGGIVFDRSSRGLVENCIVSENQLQGIEVRNGAHPVLQGCIIAANSQNGIYVQQGGEAIILRNTILTNGYSGVMIRESPMPQMVANRIYKNRHLAVWGSTSTDILALNDIDP